MVRTTGSSRVAFLRTAILARSWNELSPLESSLVNGFSQLLEVRFDCGVCIRKSGLVAIEP
jgi:hypothetical protein